MATAGSSIPSRLKSPTVTDGVFLEADGRVRFRALPKPSAEELVTLDAKGRKARIAAWAEQNKDRSEKDRLLDSVRTQPNLGWPTSRTSSTSS